jgi:hypothetical protein
MADPTITPEAIAAALGMSVGELQARLSASQGPKGPKWGSIIDAVPVADVDRVIDACREGLKVDPLGDDGPDGQLKPLRAIAPAVAAAAQANSAYRGKPIAHSLQVVIARLEGRHGPAAKRERPPAPKPAPSKEGK